MVAYTIHKDLMRQQGRDTQKGASCSAVSTMVTIASTMIRLVSHRACNVAKTLVLFLLQLLLLHGRLTGGC